VILSPDLLVDFTKDQIETGTFTPDQLSALFEVFYQPELSTDDYVRLRQSEGYLLGIKVHAFLGDVLLEGFIVWNLTDNSLSFYKKQHFWDTFSTKVIPKT
jgi:hypothetical protein